MSAPDSHASSRVEPICCGARRLGDHELEEYIAELLGYQYNPPQPPRIEPPVQIAQGGAGNDPS